MNAGTGTIKKRNPSGRISRFTDSIPKQNPVNNRIRIGMEGMETLPLDPRIPYMEIRMKKTNAGKIPQALLTGISPKVFRFSQRRYAEARGIMKP
jgi:hypothetical protein